MVNTTVQCCPKASFVSSPQYCQIDSARLPGGLNDVLAVYLMANKVGIPVCPHSGGVGLCEMVQHLQVRSMTRIRKKTIYSY